MVWANYYNMGIWQYNRPYAQRFTSRGGFLGKAIYYLITPATNKIVEIDILA